MSAEVIPQIERSSIVKNMGERGARAQGPALIGPALLGAQRPEMCDLPAITHLFAADDTNDPETGIMKMHFNAAELNDNDNDGDPTDDDPTDGNLDGQQQDMAHKHKLESISTNLAHALDHAAQAMRVAHDLKRQFKPTPADDVVKMKTPSRPLAARLDRAEKMLAEIQKRNAAVTTYFSADAATKNPPAKLVTLTAFDGAVADKVGQLTHVFLADLEGELERQGLDRDNVDVRRRVAREPLLGPWKSSPPSASLPAAPSLADQLDPEDFRHAVEDFVPSASAKASFTVQDTGEAFDRSSPTGSLETRFAQQVAQTMAQHAWDPSNTQLRRQAARLVLDDWARSPADSAYGDAGDLAAQLPEAAFERVVYGRALSADKPAHDQKERGVVGMAEHHRGFAETPRTPQRAAVLYGTAALRRDTEALWMAEGTTPAPPAYGSRGMAQPVEDARAIAFRENANEILKSIDPLDKDRVGKAWRTTASKFSNVVPDYSPFSTRAIRARG